MYEYKCTIKRVIDGDTFIGIVDLGFGNSTEQKFRIADIDTPESWRPTTEAERTHGNAANDRAKELLDGKTIHIRTSKTGKYGRWIASVMLNDGSDYATVMISEGFQKREDYI